LLTVKIGDVWTGYRNHQRQIVASVAVGESQAQTPAPAAGQAPAPAAQPTTPVQGQQTQPSRPVGQAGPAGAPPAGAAPAAGQQRAQTPPAPPVPPPPGARQDGKPLDPVIFSQSEIEILQNLSARRKEIDQREESVVAREILLQAAEKRLEEKIGELKNIRGEIEGLIRKYNEQEEAEMKSLVRIYEAMKPKDAARIFDELDLKVLLQVFQRMKEAKTAPILASMNSARAKEVTTQLAERRDVPALN
jgi:flagellar motility protein MotE (MotC chaperone)